MSHELVPLEQARESPSLLGSAVLQDLLPASK